ncbi:MAG TPA: 3-oxoacyl-ACP reductase FabG [Fulvivirga sp.]|nr:3-oxoacyl-ACP reductase FabG [Fulvivirga sp.]
MKYALVTGGSRGIGKAVCLQLAKQGFNILINYTSNKEAAEATKKEVEQLNVKADLLKFDVSDREAVRKVLSDWVDTNEDKNIEVLVNNAGIRKDNLMMWMKDEEWDDVVNISLGGFYNVTKQIIPEMIKNKQGRIINMVSLSGIKGLPGQTNYSASKAAVIGATKALAQEVARRNITVNAVAPGFIKTEMTDGIEEKDFKSVIPMRRFGTAEEVANVVGFLASPASSYITSEVISINGGLL